MEFMSNLSGGHAVNDVERPSIFELVAQEKLNDMLRPALKYVISVYAQRYPRYLLRIVNYHEEFYALLMYFVERHYLSDWGASFSENFFGIKRRRVPSIVTHRAKTFTGGNSGSQDIERLRKSDIQKSLLFLVLLPYLKTKADDYYDIISGGSGGHLLGHEFENRDQRLLENAKTKKERFRVFARIQFRKIFPYVNALYHTLNLGFNIAYMFDRTPYFNIWMRLLRLDLRRMTGQDYREHYSRQLKQVGKLVSGMPSPKTRRAAIVGLIRGIFSKSFEFLKVLLPMSIFFLKFLEWWYSSDFAKRSGGGATGIVLPPPERLEPHPRGIPIPEDPAICPSCEQPLTNPTALPSGYVFDYVCAVREVKENGRCPITLMPATLQDIRRVLA